MSDFSRPLRSWPEWMLRALVLLRKRRTMWTDAYFELVERGNDAAVEYSDKHDNAHLVIPPRGIQ